MGAWVLTLLFWNLNQKPLGESVIRLVRRHSVDVLMLAECSAECSRDLSERLGGMLGPRLRRLESLCPRIVLYAAVPPLEFRALHEDDYCTIQRLDVPHLPLLIAAAHLPSPAYRGLVDAVEACKRLADEIGRAEKREGHDRTVVVGDLNMDPFAKGVIAATGLHGVMSRNTARGRGGGRKVLRREYRFFYNPMWSLFGDDTPGPPGTYYRDKGGQEVYFWHMFDQVLVRPSILELLRPGAVAIQDSDGVASLLSSDGRPDTGSASDHLPLLFTLDVR